MRLILQMVLRMLFQRQGCFSFALAASAAACALLAWQFASPGGGSRSSAHNAARRDEGSFVFGFGIGIGGRPMGGRRVEPPAAHRSVKADAPGPTGATLAEPARRSVPDAEGASGGSTVGVPPERSSFRGAPRPGTAKRIAERTPARTGKDEAPGRDAGAFGENTPRLAWGTSGGILLTAALILVIAISAWTDETWRTFRILRACGFPRGTGFCIVVLLGFLIGFLGFLAGFPCGVMLSLAFCRWKTGAFPHASVFLKAIPPVLGCSVACAVAASLRPAWRNREVSSADTSGEGCRPASAGAYGRRALWGIAALLSLPLAASLPLPRDWMIPLLSILAPCVLAASFALLTPGSVLLCETLCTPAAAAVFGVNRTLLRRFLSSGRWRGCSGVLVMGLGLWLLVSIHVWTDSMLTLFRVPDGLPDVLVRLHPDVAGERMTAAVRDVAGRGRVMPLCVAQPEMEPELRRRMAAAGSLGDTVILMGIDGDMAWDEEHPMLELPFAEGSAAACRRAFADGAGPVCVIPASLSRHGGLHCGDRIELQENGCRMTLTVAGVVEFPWSWFSKCTGLRVREARTSGVLLVPRKVLADTLHVSENEFLWVDCPTTPVGEIERLLRLHAGRVASGVNEKRVAYSGGTRWESGLNRHFVQVSSIGSLNRSLTARSRHVIDGMVRMPYLMLLLSTIGVACTLASLIRLRAREFHILRCIGVSRSVLARLILAEGVMGGACSCALAVPLGVVYGWLSIRAMAFAPVFGEGVPDMRVPMAKILPGIALAVGLWTAAGLYAALRRERTPNGACGGMALIRSP